MFHLHFFIRLTPMLTFEQEREIFTVTNRIYRRESAKFRQRRRAWWFTLRKWRQILDIPLFTDTRQLLDVDTQGIRTLRGTRTMIPGKRTSKRSHGHQIVDLDRKHQFSQAGRLWLGVETERMGSDEQRRMFHCPMSKTIEPVRGRERQRNDRLTLMVVGKRRIRKERESRYSFPQPGAMLVTRDGSFVLNSLLGAAEEWPGSRSKRVDVRNDSTVIASLWWRSVANRHPMRMSWSDSVHWWPVEHGWSRD